MANFSVRNLDEKAYAQLRVRAAQHGVSMEEEVRQIIYQVVSAPEKLSQVFQRYFGREHGVDMNLPKRPKPHEPMDFEE